MCILLRQALAAFVLLISLTFVASPGASEIDHVLKLYATEFALVPRDTNVYAGPVRILLINEGEEFHELVVGGTEGSFVQVRPRDTAQVMVVLGPGDYTFYCPKAGHRERGMKGRLKVLAHPGGR